MKAKKHTNGYWQSFLDGRLICAALFKRKKDAISFSEEFAVAHVADYAHTQILVKKHNGFFV